MYLDDARLHAHLTFNVAHNLIDAYRGYSYNGPAWWEEGLAHHFRRAVWRESNEFSAIDEDTQRAFGTFDWVRIIKHRAGFGLVRPWEEFLDLKDCSSFDLVDHLACWSRVEFLMQAKGREAFADFVDRMKGMVDQQGKPPTDERMFAAEREALKAAFGADVATLDAEWHEWIKTQKEGD